MRTKGLWFLVAMTVTFITLALPVKTFAKPDKGTDSYIALGEDLNASEKDAVLKLMDLSEEALEECDVVYISNEMEHQYLGAYVPKEKIGTRALSSVKINLLKEGEGLTITTQNINYCTVGMYENALITAGVKDAEIMVVGPFELSGTAALIGTFEAYEKMTGKELDNSVVDAAMNELVVTGELEESLDKAAENIEAMIAELKGAIARGELSSLEDIKAAVEEYALKYDLDLTEADKEKLLNLMQKIKELDIDWGEVAKQTADIVGQVQDVMEETGVMDVIKKLFEKLIELIMSLFGK